MRFRVAEEQAAFVKLPSNWPHQEEGAAEARSAVASAIGKRDKVPARMPMVRSAPPPIRPQGGETTATSTFREQSLAPMERRRGAISACVIEDYGGSSLQRKTGTF